MKKEKKLFKKQQTEQQKELTTEDILKSLSQNSKKTDALFVEAFKKAGIIKS